MGLIRAALGSAGGVLADQWKEYFYCEAIPTNILAVKGQKRTSGRSSNTRGSDNIISNGSVIAVADGQCMIIVEQGKVVDLCAVPGEYTYDTSTEPSLFSGDLSENIGAVFSNIGKRFTFGGEAPKDQRVYYFNTKELTGNKYGTPSPVPFRVVDQRAGIDIDISLRCFGEYSYRITNPMLFYANVCGNVEQDYDRSEIDSQLKTEFISALQPAFSRLSDMEMRPNQIPAHTMELCDLMNETLTKKWSEARGISVVSIAMNPVSIPDEDAESIKELQRAAALSNPGLAAGALTGAQAEAMRTAAGNNGGAMAGFMGMGMAANAGGVNAQALYGMAAEQKAAASQPNANVWTCSCGAVNKGKFCSECGKPRPAGVPKYKCDKCGWEPEDPTHPPKFCPECGDPFNDSDLI